MISLSNANRTASITFKMLDTLMIDFLRGRFKVAKTNIDETSVNGSTLIGPWTVVYLSCSLF